MKTCKKCGIEKNDDDFAIKDKHYGYRNSTCKMCEVERVRAYYYSNKAYRERALSRSKGVKVPRVLLPKITDWVEETQTKVCSSCKRDLLITLFSKNKNGVFGRSHRCKECQKKVNQEAISTKKWKSFTSENQREYKLIKNYGITSAEYESMLSDQNGLCKICGTDNPGAPSHYRGSIRDKMVVDHDHVTGKVRGLLCYSCNIWLGNYETLIRRSSAEKLLKYLGIQISAVSQGNSHGEEDEIQAPS